MSLVSWHLTPSQAFFIIRFGVFYMWAFTFIGFFANGSIIYVTIKDKSLRSPCNILIATQAVCDIVITFGHIVFFFLLYTETLIPYSICYIYQFVPSSAMNITTALMLAIGMDRYLCLKYVAQYKKWIAKHYIMKIILACVAYDVLIKIVGFVTLTDDPAICLIAEAYAGLGKDFWVFTGLVINACVVVVYLMIRNMMKDLEDCNAESKKIVRSLYTVVGFYIFGWLMTMCVIGALRILTTEPNLFSTCEIFFGFFANLNMVIPAFVYYYRSTIYKAAYRNCFRSRSVTFVSSQSMTT